MVVFDVSEWSDVDEFDETVRSVIEVVLFARVEEVVAFGKVVVFVNESTDNNKTNSFLQHVSTGKRISNVFSFSVVLRFFLKRRIPYLKCTIIW